MSDLRIDIDRCKGCGLCIVFCPKKNLDFSEKLNKKGVRYAQLCRSKECTACGICFMVCPDVCIEIHEE